MKVIALPDLHESLMGGANGDHLKRLGARLAEVDLVLLVGDITSGNQTPAAEHILRAVQRHNPRVLAVPGNWDGPAVQAVFDAAGVNLHRRHEIVGGIAFLGVGGSLSPGIPMPCLFTEAEFAGHLEAALAGVDPALPKVLVCHQPPIDTPVDLMWNGRHVGSKAVRAFIERVQPALCFTGHIHEGRGTVTIGTTRVVNPGPLFDGHYAYAEIGAGGGVQVVEIRDT